MSLNDYFRWGICESEKLQLMKSLYYFMQNYFTQGWNNFIYIQRTPSRYIAHFEIKCHYVICDFICSRNTLLLITTFHLTRYSKAMYRSLGPGIDSLLKSLFNDVYYGCLWSPVFYLQHSNIRPSFLSLFVCNEYVHHYLIDIFWFSVWLKSPCQF